MLSDFIRQEFTRNLYCKLAAVVALPVLRHFKSRVDHRRYNGAALLGLRGLVFKSHGSADAFAFGHALDRAYDAAKHQLLARVHDRITAILTAMPESSGSATRRACRVPLRRSADHHLLVDPWVLHASPVPAAFCLENA